MKRLLPLLVFGFAHAAMCSPAGKWESDDSTTQMQFYVECKTDESLSMGLRLAGSQTQWFNGTYTATNMTVQFPEKVGVFPFEIHKDVLFLRFLPNASTRLLRVDAAYSSAQVQEAQTLYDQHHPVGWGNIRVTVEPPEVFLKRIADADKIIVRKGGMDCCSPVESQSVLFTITNTAEIASVRSHINFVPNEGAMCLCCGYPGIDWYKGTNRLSMTSLRHAKRLGWKGSDVPAALTPESAQWLVQWLLEHGVKEPAEELNRRKTNANTPFHGTGFARP
jgi:hypothetical protein